MRGSRVFAIIALVAALGGIGLALALKHQRTTIDAKKQQQHSVGPIPATK
jgi:hypothetical protein